MVGHRLWGESVHKGRRPVSKHWISCEQGRVAVPLQQQRQQQQLHNSGSSCAKAAAATLVAAHSGTWLALSN
jgi:hypothetical protein